jgi:hypothetical protein
VRPQSEGVILASTTEVRARCLYKQKRKDWATWARPARVGVVLITNDQGNSYGLRLTEMKAVLLGTVS